MVLCDHCDGMYGFQCVTPPLRKVPSKAWHCPDCKPKLKSAKGVRMLSAVAENAARKRAELGDLPKKKITQTMFLVKWAGLGYEFCTWETKEDVSNDALIAAFHRLNNGGFSDEADMPEEVIDDFLHGVKHINSSNAGGAGVVPLLRSQLYAQNRGLQFLKFGMDVPENVGCEMGPKTTAVHRCPRVALQSADCETNGAGYGHPREVVECLTDLVFRVSRQQRPRSIRMNTSLPPPLTGEYDAIIPITAKGLMMNVGEMHGSVAFLGYRQFADGSKGPAEIASLIRNVGDKIIAVDGVSTIGKSFQEVINMLRESGKNKYVYMRFLETRFAVCEGALASSGAKGRYAHEELQKKFITDRQRMVVQRKARVVEAEPEIVENEVNASAKKDDSDDESEAGSEGSFQPDSDDEELVGTINVKEVSPSKKVALPENGIVSEGFPAPSMEEAKSLAASVSAEAEENGVDNAGAAETVPSAGKDESAATTEAPGVGIVCREETTRSLGMRLLDVDLGYSSDEAGDEDCAYFLDGVDETFTNVNELDDFAIKKKSKGKDKKNEQASKDSVIPASKSEFSALGDRGKLAVAVALSTKAPSLEDFESFPEVEDKGDDGTGSTSPPKSTKRSTVKVEQVNASTGETLHVWANVESVAATLQLPLPALRQVLRGEYDEDIGEEVGGFRWRYAAAGAKVTAGNASTSRGGGGKKAKEAWLEFRDKLYDPSEPHPYKNGNRLRDYQVDGVNWLASMWYKRQGCILADGTFGSLCGLSSAASHGLLTERNICVLIRKRWVLGKQSRLYPTSNTFSG
jgi:Chromo (CHRromatin Organisation MOdifier) domain